MIGGALEAALLVPVADARRTVCRLLIDLLALGNRLAADHVLAKVRAIGP